MIPFNEGNCARAANASWLPKKAKKNEKSYTYSQIDVDQ